MGAFQSKKKYDVATGESTIKGKYQTSRTERKQDHLSRISQHNDKVNKQEDLQRDGDIIGLNREEIVPTSVEENQVVGSQEPIGNASEEKVSTEPKSAPLEIVSEKEIVQQSEETLCKIDEKSNDIVTSHPEEEKCELKINNEIPPHETEEFENIAQEEIPETTHTSETRNDLDLVPHEQLVDTESNTVLEKFEVPQDTAENIESTKSVDNSNVTAVENHLVAESEKPNVSVGDVPDHCEKPNVSVGDVPDNSEKLNVSVGDVPDHSEKPNVSVGNVLEHSEKLNVSVPDHSEKPNVSENSNLLVSKKDFESPPVTDPNVPEVHDVKSPKLLKDKNDQRHETSETVAPKFAEEKVTQDENVNIITLDNEPVKDTPISASPEELCEKQDCVNKIFLDEERKSNLSEEVSVKPSDSAKLTTLSEENEHRVISALNEIIEEAAGTVLKIQSQFEDLVQDTYSPVVLETEESKSPTQEHARKRVITGDPPTEDEISKAGVVSEEQVPQNGTSNMVMHEVSLVSESYYDNNQGEKVVSHIYLEKSLNSDDVHYTLDKLQLMEEQIQSNRSRILKIKEID